MRMSISVVNVIFRNFDFFASDNENLCWSYDLRNFWSFCGWQWAPCTSICYHRTDPGLAFDCLPAQSLLCRNHTVLRKIQTPSTQIIRQTFNAWRIDYRQSNSNMLKNRKNPKSQFSLEELAFNSSILESPLVFCNNLHLTLSTLYKTVQLLRYRLESFQTPPPLTLGLRSFFHWVCRIVDLGIGERFTLKMVVNAGSWQLEDQNRVYGLTLPPNTLKWMDSLIH